MAFLANVSPSGGARPIQQIRHQAGCRLRRSALYRASGTAHRVASSRCVRSCSITEFQLTGYATSIAFPTVISTLLLPPTFVAGAFGMNVGGIPWAQADHGFWAVLGFCAVLIFTGYVVLRRFRILP